MSEPKKLQIPKRGEPFIYPPGTLKAKKPKVRELPDGTFEVEFRFEAKGKGRF